MKHSYRTHRFILSDERFNILIVTVAAKLLEIHEELTI